MRVTQTISIGSLRINSMSNSSILQIGTSGSIKSRAKEIKEYVPQEVADQKIEGTIASSIKPIFDAEGLPLVSPETPTVGKGTASEPQRRQRKSRKHRKGSEHR